VRVSGFRQGRLRHWTVTLAAPVLNQWHLTCLPASVQAAARGAAWLAVVDTGTNA
jgi:hypothetical protein